MAVCGHQRRDPRVDVLFRGVGGAEGEMRTSCWPGCLWCFALRWWHSAWPTEPALPPVCAVEPPPRFLLPQRVTNKFRTNEFESATSRGRCVSQHSLAMRKELAVSALREAAFVCAYKGDGGGSVQTLPCVSAKINTRHHHHHLHSVTAAAGPTRPAASPSAA